MGGMKHGRDAFYETIKLSPAASTFSKNLDVIDSTL